MTRRRGRRIGTWIVLLALLAAAAWAGVKFSGAGAADDHALAGATATRGRLTISVIERGNLKAFDAVTLKCGLQGQTTVLWLIPEGTQVEAGDLLCELDASSLVDRRVSQEIRVQNAQAAFVKAEQTHAIQESQNESDIAMAEQQLDFAKLDLEKYLKGDLPQQSQSKDETILLADEELTQAAQNLQWSQRLAEKGFLEQTRLDADTLAKTRAEVTLKQAQRAKQLFEDYEIPRRKKELEAQVTEKQRELERVRLQAGARLADFDANLRTTEATLKVESDELDKIVSQIEQARLVAPVAGMVVYARNKESRWGGGEPMQEGATVRERQDVITIPSSNGYVAEASLHESVLEKVQPGMAAQVTVDALHETFPGEVSYKAVLPDQNSWFANPDLRVYRTEIKVLSEDARIRPGMSCSIEILVDQLDDVVQVPVQSVFLDAGLPVCFVSSAGSTARRDVVVGQNDGKWVEIVSGVEAGEVVLLSPPPGLELRPAADHSLRRDTDEPAAGPPGAQGAGAPAQPVGMAGSGQAEAGDAGRGKP